MEFLVAVLIVMVVLMLAALGKESSRIDALEKSVVDKDNRLASLESLVDEFPKHLEEMLTEFATEVMADIDAIGNRLDRTIRTANGNSRYVRERLDGLHCWVADHTRGHADAFALKQDFDRLRECLAVLVIQYAKDDRQHNENTREAGRRFSSLTALINQLRQQFSQHVAEESSADNGVVLLLHS